MGILSADVRRMRRTEAARLRSAQHVAADSVLLRPCGRMLDAGQPVGAEAGQIESRQRVLSGRTDRRDGGFHPFARTIAAEVR